MLPQAGMQDASHAASPTRALPEDRAARRIAMGFVAYGLFAVLFLAINLPPFQSPDEPGHFFRASQIADGHLTGLRFGVPEADGRVTVTAGGKIDPAEWQAWELFKDMPFHPETAVTRGALSSDIPWSSARTRIGFPAAAMYPPFFYAPSAIGIVAGRAAGTTVLQALMLSRLLTGAAAVAVGAAAIACAGAAAIWLFAVLTLPMSLSLIASSSQDALMLSFSALAGGLVARSLRPGDTPGTGRLVWIALALGLVGMARPPYGALALLPLALPGVRWRGRIAAAAAVAACGLIWAAIAAATATTNYEVAVAGSDPSAQAAFLLSHPLFVFHLLRQTLAVQWPGQVASFIGNLGWLDTPLPDGYYTAAKWILAAAATAAALGTRRGDGGWRSRAAIAAAVLVAAAGVFAGQYLIWTKPGAEAVEGLQGRYFLPLALAAAGALPALGGMRLAWLHRSLVAVVLAFPLVSLAVVMRAVVLGPSGVS